MIIIGAKGHAKEVLDIFFYLNQSENLFFFDNINNDIPETLYNKFLVIRTIEDVLIKIKTSPNFVAGIGGTYKKEKIINLFEQKGGILQSIISPYAKIGSFGTVIGKGANIMHDVYISNDVKIGKACLINRGASVHHDTAIGNFCEISPGSQLLGRVTIGNYVSIGAGAVILPDVTIADGAIVGAGSVVTKNVSKNTTVAGVPAKKIK